MILRVAVAAIVFWLAFDGGTYSLESRGSLSIAVWWAVIVAVGLGFLPLVRPPLEALFAGGLLAGLALLTLVSMTWAASPERAFTEFNRVALYLGVLVLVVAATSRGNVGAVTDGIAMGLAGVAALALASRLFPNLFPEGDIPTFLPSAQTRLSYPVGYWNGLAILLAVALPLQLRAAMTAISPWVRGLAVVSLPLFAAVTYLASSRGGFAAGVVALVAFVALAERRWAAVGAIGVGLAGAAAAILVIAPRGELVNGPLSSDAAVDQGRVAALLIVLILAATAAAYVVGGHYLARVRPGRLASRIAVAAVLVAALAGIAASHPVDRFETFKAPPAGITSESDFVRAHLLSGNGSGRWQFWSAAVDEFESRPVIGRGGGSYEAWWAQHGTIPYFVRDAHSLYLETLGELGIVGFLLVAGVFAAAVVAVVRRLPRLDGESRMTLAAAAAGFAAFALGAGIDWVWELTVVSVVGVSLLAVAVGPATAVAPRPRVVATDGAGAQRRSRRRLVPGVALLVGAWLLICAAAIPLFSQLKIRDSQAAVGRGDAEAALADAHAARKLQPWAASPYLQVALVREESGDLAGAREAIDDAIDHDPEDWRLWLVLARVETTAGNISAALEALDRAVALNPRSPLFADVRTR